jgi:hypothetical protein
MNFQYEDPTRLRIQKQLTAALQSISVADGYRHDLGITVDAPDGHVFRGRVLFGPEDPMPLVAILETPLQPDQLGTQPDNSVIHGSWDLTIQGFVEDDYLNPTDPAHHLVADVIRRLAVEKRRNANFELFDMGDIVTDITIGVPVVRPPDEISAKAYFYLPIVLTIAEDLYKPYGDETP